ncbi:MAG: hypothetical protein WCS88_04085 [Patescibacteria group bacterium]|jgi:hypothetical protein
MLLGAVNVPILHRPGGWTAGEWVAGTPELSSVPMSVQPLNGRELQNLPEGQRTRGTFKAYTLTELVTVQMTSPHLCDLVTWHSRNYEVHGVEDWTAHTSGQPHFKYLLVEVAEDERFSVPAGTPGPDASPIATQSWVTEQIMALRPNTATLRPVPSSGLITDDPTSGSIDAAGQATTDAEVVLHVLSVDTADNEMLAIIATLVWGVTVSGGTGSTRWLISEDTETVGQPPSAGASPISGWFSATAGTNRHSKSGRVPDSALPEESFYLLLTGKVTAGTLTATISEETTLEVTF